MTRPDPRPADVLPVEAFDPLAALIARERAPPAVQPSFAGEALERRPVAEQVFDRLLGMIRSGNLKAGDRLPTEQQMTLAFGISRPPLREALKSLTRMGVLESRQGGRYTVTDLSPSRLIAPFNAMLALAECDPQEHLEARAAIDCELVRLCTERATEEERRHILKLAVDGRAFHDDPVGFRLLDIAFHQALHAGARHRLFFALSQILYDIGLDVRRLASAMPGVVERSVSQHIEIAEAVMAGDAAAAQRAYRGHLEHVRDTTRQSLDRTSRDGGPALKAGGTSAAAASPRAPARGGSP